MADILNLQIKDDSLNNVISNNPYYVDVKGSVNICLIRCGQTIETCNNVEFSTMTNYGKVLVLNPNVGKKSMCKIKLAFDTSNDNTNNNGDADYKFEKAMITVPSLHKLNGQVFDMETFLIFSSTQKNGDVLYVCLCALSMGTPLVQNNDWKLLNYKLINELFAKNNTVPDMYGTNNISGVPNPVDLSNFIPPEGLRNFYDYTHPSNTKVNFRIYQTPLAVSNEVLTILKSKLTPGNIYTNFRDAISKTINPPEGLFFYFSEDLTNRYKSFSVNEKPNNSKEKYENENDNENENENDSTSSTKSTDLKENNETKSEFKKIDTTVKKKEVKEVKETDEFDETVSEKFDDTEAHDLSNDESTIIYIIIAFLFIFNLVGFSFIFNIFKGPTDSKSIDFNNLTITNEIKSLLSTKFRYFCCTFFHGIITIIILLLFSFYIGMKDTNITIYAFILLFLIFIFIIGAVSIFLIIKYGYLHLTGMMDPKLLEKETYWFGELRKKLPNSDITIFLSNLYNALKGDFYFLNDSQSGGGDTINIVPGINNIVDDNIGRSNTNEIFTEHLKKASYKDTISIIKCKLSNNLNISNGFASKSGLFVVGFFIVGSIFHQYVANIGTKIDTGLSWLLTLNISLYSFLPLGLLFIFSAYVFETEWLKWVTIILVTLALISSILIPVDNSNDSPYMLLKNIPYSIFMSLYILVLLFLGIYSLFGYINTNYIMSDEAKKEVEVAKNDACGNLITRLMSESFEKLKLSQQTSKEKEEAYGKMLEERNKLKAFDKLKSMDGTESNEEYSILKRQTLESMEKLKVMEKLKSIDGTESNDEYSILKRQMMKAKSELKAMDKLKSVDGKESNEEYDILKRQIIKLKSELNGMDKLKSIDGTESNDEYKILKRQMMKTIDKINSLSTLKSMDGIESNEEHDILKRQMMEAISKLNSLSTLKSIDDKESNKEHNILKRQIVEAISKLNSFYKLKSDDEKESNEEYKILKRQIMELIKRIENNNEVGYGDIYNGKSSDQTSDNNPLYNNIPPPTTSVDTSNVGRMAPKVGNY